MKNVKSSQRYEADDLRDADASGESSLPEGLFKRPDSKLIWARLSDGTRASTGKTDVAEALVVMRQKNRELTSKNIAAKHGPVFGDVWELWIAGKKESKVDKRSLATVESRYKAHHSSMIGDTPLKEMDRQWFAKYTALLNSRVNVITKEPLGIAQRRRLAADLKVILDIAVYEGLLTRSPWPPGGISVHGAQEINPEQNRVVFRIHHIEALLRSRRVPLDRRVLYATAFLLGLRTSETPGLKFSDFNEREGTVTIRRQAGRAQLKTNGSRCVPVHPSLRQLLRYWKDQGYELVYSRTPSENDDLFPLGPEYRGRFTYRTADYMAQKLAIDLTTVGLLEPGLTPHKLRKGFVSELLDGGVEGDIRRKFTHSTSSDSHGRYVQGQAALYAEAVSTIKAGPWDTRTWRSEHEKMVAQGYFEPSEMSDERADGDDEEDDSDDEEDEAGMESPAHSERIRANALASVEPSSPDDADDERGEAEPRDERGLSDREDGSLNGGNGGVEFSAEAGGEDGENSPDEKGAKAGEVWSHIHTVSEGGFDPEEPTEFNEKIDAPAGSSQIEGAASLELPPLGLMAGPQNVAERRRERAERDAMLAKVLAGLELNSGK